MFFDYERPDWEREGRDWPNRATSQFVQVKGMRWHVQRAGGGEMLLLVHGTGASTHSWRGLFPLLAQRFDVLSIDLPAHGFTSDPGYGGLALPAMAQALRALLRQIDFQPAIVTGHSAGAAVLARLCLDGAAAPHSAIFLNPALTPFEGFAGQIFPGLAKLLFLNPVTPRLFAWAARDRATVAKLIRDTGSTIDEFGLDLYQRLFRCSGHVAGTLGMMASWDLKPLLAEIGRFDARTLLLIGAQDRAVPPDQSDKVLKMLPRAAREMMSGLGHLAHEERPDMICQAIRAFIDGAQAAAGAAE